MATWIKGEIRSIDAWRDPDGWTWNNSSHVEEGFWISTEGSDLAFSRRLLGAFRRAGWLSDYSKGRVRVDHGHAYIDPMIVVEDKSTREPLIALIGEWVHDES